MHSLQGLHSGGQLVAEAAGEPFQSLKVLQHRIQVTESFYIFHLIISRGLVKKAQVAQVLSKALCPPFRVFLQCLDQILLQQILLQLF